MMIKNTRLLVLPLFVLLVAPNGCVLGGEDDDTEAIAATIDNGLEWKPGVFERERGSLRISHARPADPWGDSVGSTSSAGNSGIVRIVDRRGRVLRARKGDRMGFRFRVSRAPRNLSNGPGYITCRISNKFVHMDAKETLLGWGTWPERPIRAGDHIFIQRTPHPRGFDNEWWFTHIRPGKFKKRRRIGSPDVDRRYFAPDCTVKNASLQNVQVQATVFVRRPR